MKRATKKALVSVLLVAAGAGIIGLTCFAVWRVRLGNDHLLKKGYVVYSVGVDGEDNGGREKPINAKSSDKTHYDITFTVER